MFLTSAMIGLVPLEDMVVNSASASLTQMVGGLLKTFFFLEGVCVKVAETVWTHNSWVYFQFGGKSI